MVPPYIVRGRPRTYPPGIVPTVDLQGDKGIIGV